jgi:hypothetical protein
MAKQPPRGERDSAHERKEAQLIGQLAKMHRGVPGLCAHHPAPGKKAHSRRRK